MTQQNTEQDDSIDDDPILTLHTTGTEGNILREDLTAIVTDAVAIRKAYFQDLMRLCIVHQGHAVAANQVGLRENFFFVLANEKVKFPRKNPSAAPVHELCVNPKWRPLERAATFEEDEGCLSMPGRRFKVRRYRDIIAEWNNAVGHRVSAHLKGLVAEIFQHEHDHLRGVLLTDHGKEVTSEPEE